jgi:hypothetical protein
MRYRLTILLAIASCAALPALAQFTSGSTGADGALTIPPDSGTVLFDPVALNLDVDGDNIFHFTTISIGSNSTLVLRASKLRKNAAVVFLASGSVTIGSSAGIDLSGESGVDPGSTPQIKRRPTDPGPGGFAGGLGNRITGAPTPPTSGYGPSGSAGIAPANSCVGGGHALSNHMSVAMIPLVGGAGGAGGFCSTNGPGGGAGGGAIRIVSSASIAFSGSSFVRANGGSGGPHGSGISGGSGGGGMIHLIAPAVTSSGAGNLLSAVRPGWSDAALLNGSGVVRINATSITGTFSGAPAAITGALFSMPLPSLLPEVTLTQVDGVNVANPPSGLPTGADVVISSPSASTVTIAARNIPPGTVVTLRISSEVVADQSITCNGLAGTLANSTATCQATFPLGANITIAAATW